MEVVHTGGGPLGVQYDKCAAAVPTAGTARPQHGDGSGSSAIISIGH